MRSFMQTLCHCETNPSDSSPHSGVNTCLNSDPGRIMALLSLVSLFFIACLMRKAEYLVRAFFNVATFWSPESRSGVKWCDEQLHPSDALSPALRCKMHREHQKKDSVHPGPTADRIHFFYTGCHFTLGLCVCVFLQPEKVFMHSSSPSFIKWVICIH